MTEQELVASYTLIHQRLRRDFVLEIPGERHSVSCTTIVVSAVVAVMSLLLVSTMRCLLVFLGRWLRARACVCVLVVFCFFVLFCFVFFFFFSFMLVCFVLQRRFALKSLGTWITKTS